MSGTFNINQINVNVTDVIPPDNFATIDAGSKIGSVYTKEQDNAWRKEVEATTQSGIKGVLKPNTPFDAVTNPYPTPWAAGDAPLYEKYDVNQAGPFPNTKDADDENIIVTQNDLDLNEVQIWIKNGVAEKVFKALPQASVNVRKWEDLQTNDFPLNEGSQVIFENGHWMVDEGKTVASTDVPGASDKWVSLGGRFKITNAYDVSNDTDAVSAKLLDVEYFGGVKGSNPQTITTYSDWSVMTTATGSHSDGVIYVPMLPVNTDAKVITNLKIKGFGKIEIYTVTTSFQSTLLTTLNLNIDGENTFNSLNLILPANCRIGMKKIDGGKFYFNETGLGVPTYATPPGGQYNLTMPLQYTYDNSYPVPVIGKVNELIDAKIEAINPESGYNLNLFFDDFSSNSGKWITTTWTLNTSSKTYTSSVLGRGNNLFLDKIYNLNQRKITFKLIPSANTDFRIELKNKTAGNDDGASMFSINFAEGKLKIFNVTLGSYPNPEIASTGVSETSVLKEENLIPFVSGREYLVELKYSDMAHTLTVVDTHTAQKSVLYFNGWAGGRQQQSYSFYVYSGGVVSVKDVNIFALQDYYDTIFAGDSITEGIMVYDKSKRWWKLMEPDLKGIIGVSARGGQTLSDLINRFPDEIAIIKPKYLVVLIGINNPANATSANYLLLKQMCQTEGIILKVCLLTCANSGNHVAINNNIIAGVGDQSLGYKFNLATSINNDGVNINTTLFYDGLHPIEAGCQEMLKRVFVDVPEILK